jgi:hypothetical protein
VGPRPPQRPGPRPAAQHFLGRLATSHGSGSGYNNGYPGGGGDRCVDSTNGCTVIAPLVGYRHIKWGEQSLPDSHVEHVIDADCPPILRDVRAKFSLPSGAFVVPADVHDFLFDKKLLEEVKREGAELVFVCAIHEFFVRLCVCW